MASIKRPAVAFSVCFLLSAFITGMGYYHICAFISVFLIPFLLYFGISRKNYRKAFFILIIIFSLLYPSVYNTFTQAHKKSMYEELSDKHSFTATVNDISYRGKSVYIYADIHGENGKPVGNATFTKAFPDKLPDLYDTVYFEGDIYPINRNTVEKLSLYGDENYYFADRCFLAADVNDIKVLGRMPKEHRSIVHHYYFYICDNIRNAIPIYNGTDPFSYIPALLAGNRALIPYEVTQAYTRSGLIPYLCISGLHVAIAAGILLSMLKTLKINRYLKVSIVFVFLFFICLITGFSGSVMRASVMSGMILIGECFERKTDKFTSLAIALCVVLLHNPYAIFDFGTRLSFLAMLGLCNSSYITFYYEDKSFLTMIKKVIVSSFIVSGYVLIPLICVFGGAYLLSPIASIPAAIFTPIMYLLVFMAFFAFMPYMFLCILGYPVSFLLVIFERLAITFSQIPYSYAEFDCPTIFPILFIILLSFNIFCVIFKKEKYIVFSGVLLSLLAYINTIIMHVISIYLV